MSNVNVVMGQAAAASTPVPFWDLSYAYYDSHTKWNLSTAVYALKNFSVSLQETGPEAVFFKPDGTKMYVVGTSGDDVNEYNLNISWDVATAVFVQSFSVSAQETGARGLFFRDDGTRMYITGAQDEVNQYTLTTAWDVSTASYAGLFSVVTQEIDPRGLFFKPDGTKMYVLGTSAGVNEYNLSTPWDITTASSFQALSVSSQDSVPTDISFSPDGIKMFVLGATGDSVYEYTLSTAWDISTSSYIRSFLVNQGTTPTGLYFNPNGSGFYVLFSDLDAVYQYAVGGVSVTAQESLPTDIYFKPDGTKMYIVGAGGDEVNAYDLSTAWDISTLSHVTAFSVSGQDTAPRGLFFKPDGTKMYIAGDTGNDINEYNLSVAWNINTSSFVTNFSVLTEEDAPQAVYFKPDGTKMYVLGRASDFVREYTLSTPWSISTASYTQGFSVAAQEATPTGIYFREDGKKMYVCGSGYDVAVEYDLSAAWDVSTATHIQTITLAYIDSSPEGISFKDDGSKMFILGGQFDKIQEFAIGVQ